MSFLKRLFKPKEEGDYETILAKLADDVRNRQTRLSEIRLRERRSTLLATLYTLAAWGAYISLWYTSLLPRFYNTRRQSEVEKAMKAIPVFLGPIIILFIRRIVQIWYRRKGDAEEKTLQQLLKKQRSVVEDIKKKTNYYSTQELLSKYDSTPMNSPLRQRVVSSPVPPGTPQQLQTTPSTARAPVPPALQPPPPSPFMPRKQWYDKVADVLLGDEDSNTPTSRYALICEKCHAHNGLVKESLWDDTEYTCPKCNHFNHAPRSRKTPSRGTSPQLSGQYSSPEAQRRSASTRRAAKSNAASPAQRSDAGMMEVDS
ncbi:hypothetical protein F5887DRAFT_1237987 [Amanita rubescens]|nr:hypothetical protein F5887DRAFT_1253738 [Amanita rubescens]KAF8338429.1 hypothetical protein F5887DRAFT_1237987 [Amanita rubescens]